MEILKAKTELENLIEEYNASFSKFGIKTLANVYFLDSKTFLECKEDEQHLDSICASITLVAKDAEDESGMCGFDIVLQIKKNKFIDDKEFEEAVAEFSETANDFIKRLEEAPDKDAFIKEESEREKKEAAEKMKQFESEMQKTQTAIVIGACAVAALVIISILVSVIFG